MVLKRSLPVVILLLKAALAACQPVKEPLISRAHLLVKQAEPDRWLFPRGDSLCLPLPNADTLCFSAASLPALIDRLRFAHPDSLEGILRGRPAPGFPLNFPPPGGLRPLDGWRIALDPGHMAGDYAEARLEGKSVCIQGDSRVLFEAQLNLATAWLLHDSLAQLGAEVYMTRTGSGSLTGLSFTDWKNTRLSDLLREEVAANRMTPAKAEWYHKKATAEQLYQRLYNLEDLRARAEAIQAFRPHLTLFIHYNVHAPNIALKDARHCVPLADSNYLMAFVPGSFLPEELATVADCAALLRIGAGPDLDYSLRLSAAFLRHSERLTGVQPATGAGRLFYLDQYCLPAGAPGLYARNLHLLRKVGGVVCFGEPLCQDSRQEFGLLQDHVRYTRGLPVSPRIMQVAQAYLEAVKEFSISAH